MKHSEWNQIQIAITEHEIDGVEIYGNENFIQFKTGMVISHLTPHLGKNPSILDIGCKSGVVANRLIDLGYEVEGFDISEKAVNIANSYHKRFWVADVHDFKTAKKYDAILMIEVVEHLARLRWVYQIGRHIRKNGLIFIVVPIENKQDQEEESGHFAVFKTKEQFFDFVGSFFNIIEAFYYTRDKFHDFAGIVCS